MSGRWKRQGRAVRPLRAAVGGAVGADIDAVEQFLRPRYSGKRDEARGRHAYLGVRLGGRHGDNPELDAAAIPGAGRRRPGVEGSRTFSRESFRKSRPLAFEARRLHGLGEAAIAEGCFEFRHRKTGIVAEADGMPRFGMRVGGTSGGPFCGNIHAVAARV